MIDDGLITKTRYNIDELDTLLDDFTAKNVGQIVDGKQGEIIFVMKENGEMVFSMRRADDYLPHPVLSYGEDVQMAGTITPGDQLGQIFVSNKSGHFRPEGGKDNLQNTVFSKLEEFGFTPRIDESNTY